MRRPELDDLGVQAENKAVDEYVRRRFGVEPREDQSGLLVSEPTPPAGEPDEEELFQAYMRRYFPGSVA